MNIFIRMLFTKYRCRTAAWFSFSIYWLLVLTTSAFSWAQTPEVSLTLGSPDHGSLFASSGQTVTGSVTPVDATLTLDGQAVTVLPDGTFTTSVTLSPGLNTLRFKADKTGYISAVRTLDLIWDQTAPSITITSPDAGAYLNRLPLVVTGRVRDTHDHQLTLTRDGNPVPVTDGGFTDTLASLATGANTFTYQAADSSGHTQTLDLTVHFNDQAPSITLQAPGQVEASTAFDITVSAMPSSEIASLSLEVGNEVVYQAADGATHTHAATLEAGSSQVTVQARARDIYGNARVASATVHLARERVVHGQVLLDATGEPLAGLTVHVETPTGVATPTTDANGAYQVNVSGAPITVRLEDGGYVPMVRHELDGDPIWRVPDLRATALGATAPSGMTVTPSGFTGTPRLSFFGAQALPDLLPLGWSPVAGFTLDQVTGTGSLTWQSSKRYLPPGATFALLAQQDDGWQVVDLQPSDAFDFQWDMAEAGSYLVAVADAWAITATLAPGSTLRREQTQAIAPGTAGDAQTDPAQVSILDNPQTSLTHVVPTDGSTLSGSQTRMVTQERHQYFHQPPTSETYAFDVFYYSYSHGDHQQPDRLGGRLEVRARRTVDPQQTERATLAFKPGKLSDQVSETPGDLVWELPGVTLDFAGAYTQTPIMDVVADPAEGLPLIARSQLVQAFTYSATTDPMQAPLVTVDLVPSDAAEVILLREVLSGWQYAGRLMPNADVWEGGPGALDLTAPGTYALVALTDAITELRGTVMRASQAEPDAMLRGEHIPWLGVSDAAGSYRYLVPQLNADQTVSATSGDQRHQGHLALTGTQGVSLLENQTVTLDPIGFTLIDHTPVDGASHAALLPRIELQFNLPLTEDESLLAANITLTDAGSNGVPLQILPAPGRQTLHLVPTQALTAATTHTLSIQSGLLSWAGDPYDGLPSFQFTTRAATVTTPLDLQRFYLEWDTATEVMTLVGPATAYASGTSLEVFVDASGYGLTTTLTSGEYRHEIEALPGDMVRLVAVAPDGTTHRASISRVARSDGSMMLGTQPQTLALDAETDLEVGQVGAGARKLFRIDALTPTEMTTFLDEVPSFEDGPIPTAIRGYALTGENGAALPDISGQVVATLDPSAWANGFLTLLAIVPDIMVPPDPTQPTQLQAHSFAYLMDVLVVLDGEVIGDGVATAPGGVRVPLRFDLGNATYPITDQAHLVLVHTPSAAAKQGPQTASKNAGQVPRLVNLRALRKNTEFIAPPPVTPAPWHILALDAHPVPGTIVYQSLIVGGLPDVRVQGITGSNGEIDLFTYAPLGKLRALDPATNELAYAGLGDPDSVNNIYGQAIVLSSVSRVLFDPTNHLILTGQSPPPGLSVNWEVGIKSEGVFVPDLERTGTLQRRNKIQMGPSLVLRVTATSDQPIGNTPGPSLSTSGGSEIGPLEQESYRAIFEMPPETLTSERLLVLTLTITNEGGQTTEVHRDVLVTGSSTPGTKPGPPVLIAHSPKDGATVPITERPYLSFSEPVTGVTDQTVQLTRHGDPIDVQFRDQNGNAVTGTDAVTELFILPQQSLRLDATFQLQVSNLVDLNNIPMTAHQSTFHTSEVNLESLVFDQTVQDMAGYRNLVLALIHDWAADDMQLTLYDIRNPIEPMALVWSLPVDLRFALRYRLALFTPDQLDPDRDPAEATALRNDARHDRPLENLPVGTIAAVAFQRTNSAKTELILLTFDGTSFEPSDPFPLFGFGWPEATAALGRHLLIGYYQNEEVVASSIGGATVVYDLPALIRDYPALLQRYQSRSITPLEFEQELHRVGIVAKYPLPGDVRQITPFFRKAGDRYQPAMLISGATRPAIYPFDLNQQPLALGVPVEAPNTPGLNLEADGVTPKYDGRMLAYTDYPDGPSTTKKGNGAVEQLTYLDPRTDTLKTSDFAIFSNYYQDVGSLTIYELPESLLPTHEVLDPLIHMTVPEGVASLAVEPELGFVAITTRDGRFTVFELRALLEGLPSNLVGTHFIADGLNDPSVMVTPRDGNMDWLRFHQGNLFGGDEQNQLNRLPLAPNDFREAGWEVYDLAGWLNPVSPGEPPRHFTPKLAEAVVLYASDLVLEEGGTRHSKFVMELGTFDLEIRGRADVYVQIHALANGQPAGSPVVDIERLDVTGPKLEPFSTHGLADHFKATTPQKALRASKYQAFRLSYRVLEGQHLAASGHSDFAVVYTGPQTRFQDGWRGMDSVDALTLMPDLATVDYDVSSGLPSLALSPSRVYHVGSAFQRGGYGVGMLNGQLLHMAMPSWWRLDKVGTGVPSANAAIQRLMLTQPGHFHAQYQIESDGSAQALDDLFSKFETKDGYWQLTQDDRVQYLFASGRPLPQLYDLFQKANPGSGQDVKKLRFPLFRLASGPQAPGQLYAEVPLEKQSQLIWENTLQPSYNQIPSARPNQLLETVADTANGQRTLAWSYSGSVAGKVISKADLTTMKTMLSYAHDADGYLTEVRIMDERPMTYTWASIGLTIGKLPIKRLVKIEQGNWFTRYHYEGPSDLIVSAIETPFGIETLEATFDLPQKNRPKAEETASASYLPKKVALTCSIPDCPTRTVHFGEVDGQWLSSSETIGTAPSEITFNHTWTRKTNGGRSRYLLASQSRRSQSFSYDERGRRTEHVQGGGVQSWTYHNEAGFRHIPKTFIDAEGQNFTISATRNAITTTSGGAVRTLKLSGSGIPFKETNPLGLTFGAKGTAYYAPSGSGFEQALGRPKKQPLAGNRYFSSQTWQPNAIGELETSSHMGAKTIYENYDDRGRPGKITTLNGVATTFAYTYEGGLYKVTQTQGEGESALTQTSFYSARGNLIRQIQAFGGASVTKEYTYDVLGRLLTISKQAGSGPSDNRYQATYDPTNLSSQPNSETSDGVTLTYTLAEDYQPRITAVQRIVDGKGREVKYATDALGRTIISEMEGVGLVYIAYDSFDRITEILSLVEGKTTSLGRTNTYGPKTITINDGFSGIQTTVTYHDDAGWSRTVHQTGNGLDEAVTRRYTTLLDPGAVLPGIVSATNEQFGYAFIVKETGGLVEKTSSISATGHVLGSQYGNYAWHVPSTERDPFGNPKTIAGVAPHTMTYDQAGRLTGLQDANGLHAGFSYDDHFRLGGLTDTRNKPQTLSYIDASDDLKQVAIVGQNIDASPSVTTYSGSPTNSRTEASTETWQGRLRGVEETVLDTEIQVTKIHDLSEVTATVVQDPQSGLLQSITNYSGEQFQFIPSNFGKHWDILTPNNETWQVDFDGLGQLREVRQGEDRKLTIRRDEENRIRSLDTGTLFFQYIYDGPDLTEIRGATPILLSNHNGQGQAQTIEIGDLAKLEVGYHPNGTPQTLLFGNLGGRQTQITTNTHGDLQTITRDGQSTLTFTTNEWGAPATMQVGNGPVLELFSGDLQTLHLPANVTATLDREGRIKTIDKAGVAILAIGYDADDRPTAKFLGDATSEEYQYVDGYLYIKLTHDYEPVGKSKTGQNHDETQTYSRDGRGRITQIDSTLDGTSSYDYVLADNATPLPEARHSDRLKTYTDPNGVVYRYDYNGEGYVSRIDIENGPTFANTYDPAGNLLNVSVDAMAASFANYQRGLPSDVSWVYESQTEQSFTLTRTTNGRFQEIANGDYRLTLEWSSDPAFGVSPMPMITKMTKKGPGMKEVWEPVYDADERLTGITITRTTGSDVDADPACGDCQTTVIEETYGSMNQLMTGLTRIVDGITVLDTSHTLDPSADQRRIGERQAGLDTLTLDYDDLGSITAMAFSTTVSQAFDLDGTRRPREIHTTTSSGTTTETFGYDTQNRRISRDDGGTHRIYAHHGSRVIAMGTQDADGLVTWTHAFGHGPLGPVFIRDLTEGGNDAFIFSDHLGTPFAYHNPVTDTTTYTPFNPWGELLATTASNNPPWAGQGQIPTTGFTLAPDSTDTLPPLGLAGHLYDRETGLVQMHHRYYSPRLGHFLTPDYRAPDIYDPSTFTEPYAYAAGNPMLYWDPDGLAVIYLGDGRVKIEALDIYGVLQVLYLPQEHWIKLVTGQAGGYGPYTGENFLLREGTPDLNTAQGRAEYKARANAVLENFFGPGTEITASHSDTNKVIVSTVVNGSLLAIGLPAGASSGFAFVRGLSLTAEAGLSGYAIYDGSGNIYEGIQDGNAGQVVWGTLETAAGVLGGYGSVRALTGEIRAGLGSGALVVDDALLNAYVAESLGPVAQRNRLVVQNNSSITSPSRLIGSGESVPYAGGYLRSFTLEKDKIFFRVFSGDRNVGGFLTGVKPKNSAFAQEGLSLPRLNTAEFIQEVFVPAGTRLQRSRALPMRTPNSIFPNRRGGLEQFELLDRIAIENFGPGVPFK